MLLFRSVGWWIILISLGGFGSCVEDSSEKKLPTTWYCVAQCLPKDPAQCQNEGGVGTNKDKAEAERQAEHAARTRAAPCQMKSCDVSCEEKMN